VAAPFSSSRPWFRELGRPRFISGAGLLLAALLGAILTMAVFPTFDQLDRAAIWGLVLLVSFAGWGSLVARWTAAGGRADVGLRLAWGMAVLLAVGGIACLASIATRGVLLALVLVGVALEYRFRAVTMGGAAIRPRLRDAAVLVPMAVLVTLQYYGGAAGLRLTADDHTAYLVYPQKILAAGTLLEPFSLRRLASYGGQSLLQAFTLIGSAHAWQLPLLDMGICLVVVLALIVADRDRVRTSLWWVPVLLLLTLPNIRANSASLMSGVVFFLALFRTASSAALEASPWRRRVVLGMLAAAVGTLRQSYLVVAAAFLLIYDAPALVGAVRLSGPDRWRRLAGAAVAPASMLACLVPWALLSYRATGTPLYPLFTGNYRAEYGQLTAAHPSMAPATWLWINVRHCYPIRTLPLFLAAAMLVPWRLTRGALPALLGASLLGFVAIVLGFQLSDEWSMSRYYTPFMLATVLAVSMHVCSQRPADWRRDPVRAAAPAALLLAAVVFQVQGIAAQSYNDVLELVARVRGAARESSALVAQGEPYRALQASIPAGAPLFVMLDRPFLLDFRRNPIDLIDLPGQVSPPPGVPFEDDEAFVRYLTAQGFRYVAFVRSKASEHQYRRETWQGLVGLRPSPLWRKGAPLVLKVLDRFEGLDASRSHVYDDGRIVALDLAMRTTSDR